MKIFYNTKKKRGFVILFAVTISSILLAIALGVANIALKEVKFGTNARDTNDAFFAADTGTECALYYDRSDQNKFPLAGPATSINCANENIAVDFFGGTYVFTVTGLGSAQASCAKVTVTKTSNPPNISTAIVSKGYNTGGGSGSCNPTSNSVERELDTNY